MNFVLDNSVVMRWFFGDGKPGELAYAGKVLDALRNAVARVPGIWAMEAANVIAKAEAKELVTEARSEVFLEMLGALDIEAEATSVTQALSDVLDVARRYGLSAYDASYLDLALREGLPLATLDEGLERAARKAGVRRFAPR